MRNQRLCAMVSTVSIEFMRLLMIDRFLELRKTFADKNNEHIL